MTKPEGLRPPSLSNRCRIHASKMDEEGWYVTANVLVLAADELDRRATPQKLKKMSPEMAAIYHGDIDGDSNL